MTARFLAPAILLALALSSCDQSSSSSTGPSRNPSTTDPAALVGSWKMPSGDYATQYFVFRADGTGKAMSLAGTRRAISDFTWRFAGDSLELTKEGKSSRISIEYRGDTLAFYSPGYFGPSESDFTKTAEPDLTPAEGDHPATAVGDWRRLVPSVSESYTGDSLTGTDTFWNQELLHMGSDGLASVVGFEMDEDCSSEVEGCKTVSVPADTMRYRWWTSGSDLYLQLRGYSMVGVPEMTQDFGENGPVQIVGWSATSDSLHLRAYFEPYARQDYDRVP